MKAASRSTFRTRRTHWLLSALVVFGSMAPGVVGVAGAEAPAATTAAEPTITLLEPGEEPRTELRLRPQVGETQEAELRMQMTVQQKMGGNAGPVMTMPTTRIVMEITTDEVAANGDVHYTAQYVDASIIDEPGFDPQLREQMLAGLEAVEGMTLRAVVSDRGFSRSSQLELPDEADPLLAQQAEGVASSLDQFSAPFPAEAVGVGARWQVTSTITQQGMTMDQTATYSLLSIEGGTVELGIELEQGAEPQDVEAPTLPPEVSVRLLSLQGTGGGTSRLDLGALVPLESTAHTELDLETSTHANGQTFEMGQSLVMEMSLGPVED